MVSKQLVKAKTVYAWSKVFIYGFFIKSYKENINSLEEYLHDIKGQLDKCSINIDINFDYGFQEAYSEMIDSFKRLISSEKIWDVTSKMEVDQFATRSSASDIITREIVKFNIANIDIIKSKCSALHLENKNGGDIYIYPSFAMILEETGKFALVDIKDLKIIYYPSRFIETDTIPSDSQIIDYTWEKVNKNGQPDRRFSHNPKLPIVEYGKISVISATGVNEEYMVSSKLSLEKFAINYSLFQKSF